MYLFFFKQKTAYELRISDWSSDVCAQDPRLPEERRGGARRAARRLPRAAAAEPVVPCPAAALPVGREGQSADHPGRLHSRVQAGEEGLLGPSDGRNLLPQSWRRSIDDA